MYRGLHNINIKVWWQEHIIVIVYYMVHVQAIHNGLSKYESQTLAD